MIINILFYVFGALLVIAAIGVITARNPCTARCSWCSRSSTAP